MTSANEATTPHKKASKPAPGKAAAQSHYAQDAPALRRLVHLGGPDELTILPEWQPKVGDVLEGELAWRSDGIWGRLAEGELIRLRVDALTDVPLRLAGSNVLEELRKLGRESAFGTRLRFTRLADRRRWKRPIEGREPPLVPHFSVELVEPLEDDAA